MKLSIREMDRLLNRNPSTISRELKIDIEIKKYVENKLNKNWTPEQIVNYKDNKPINFPSVCTIYRWIHLGLLNKITMQNLKRKGTFKRLQK